MSEQSATALPGAVSPLPARLEPDAAARPSNGWAARSTRTSVSTNTWANVGIATGVGLAMLVIAVVGIRITARTQVAMALVEASVVYYRRFRSGGPWSASWASACS